MDARSHSLKFVRRAMLVVFCATLAWMLFLFGACAALAWYAVITGKLPAE